MNVNASILNFQLSTLNSQFLIFNLKFDTVKKGNGPVCSPSAERVVDLYFTIPFCFRVTNARAGLQRKFYEATGVQFVSRGRNWNERPKAYKLCWSRVELQWKAGIGAQIIVLTRMFQKG